jgi:hypothetical protein
MVNKIRAYLVFLLALASCATGRYAPAIDAKVDSTLVATGIPPLAVHKLKFTGPVTIQVGQGNTSSQIGTDKTGQRAKVVSTGAGSPCRLARKGPAAPGGYFCS